MVEDKTKEKVVKEKECEHFFNKAWEKGKLVRVCAKCGVKIHQ